MADGNNSISELAAIDCSTLNLKMHSLFLKIHQSKKVTTYGVMSLPRLIVILATCQTKSC